MSHPAQRQFFEQLKAKYPNFFDRVTVLDCGSLDVNGSLKDFFTNSNYTGIDIHPGPGVDIVCKVHEWVNSTRYDVIVSGEMLEHDEHWDKSLQRMYEMTRPGGLLAISAAGEGRAEHGTAQTDGMNGYAGTDGLWGTSPDYYRNITEEMFIDALGIHRLLVPPFSVWDIEENSVDHDIYFWGLKA